MKADVCVGSTACLCVTALHYTTQYSCMSVVISATVRQVALQRPGSKTHTVMRKKEKAEVVVVLTGLK